MSLVPTQVFDLSGRVALITGGATGIGLMIARGLGAAGAKVYIAGRRQAVLDKIVQSWEPSHGAAVALALDVSNRASILSAAKIIEEAEGKLHILVNNAGQSGPTTSFFNDMSAPEHKDAGTLGQALFDAQTSEDWANLYAANTFPIFFMTTAFLGLLSKGSQEVDGWTSSVINITSVSGIVKLAQNHFAYNSSKAAATHLTKMFATELALKKVPVRVNAIAPGVYASEMTEDDVTSPETVEKIAQVIVPVPAARAGTAQEIAGTVIYLSSRAGCYTNGQEIAVDGGFTAVNPSTA